MPAENDVLKTEGAAPRESAQRDCLPAGNSDSSCIANVRCEYTPIAG